MADYFAPVGTPPPTSLPDPPPPDVNADGLWNGINKQFEAAAKNKNVMQGFVDFMVAAFAGIIAAGISIAAFVINKVAVIVLQGQAEADGAMSQLSATVVEGLLGVRVNMGQATHVGAFGERRQAARDVGDGVLKGLFEGAAPSGPDGLVPSDVGARHYLEMVCNLGMEGWLQGFIMEEVSLGHFEKFGELKDIMVKVLGIERLSRMVLKPAADAFVARPYQWKINKDFRPELLSPGQLASAYRRKLMTRDEVHEEMARQGWSDKRIDILLTDADKFLSVSQLAGAVARKQYTREDAQAQLRKQGWDDIDIDVLMDDQIKNFSASDVDYLISHQLIGLEDGVQELVSQGWSDTDARIVIRMTEDQRIEPYRKEMASTAMAAYVAKDIESDQFQRILQTSGLSQREQQYIYMAGGLKRELHAKQLTDAEMEESVDIGLKGIDDYRAFLLRQGYSLADAQTKELLLLKKIKGRADAVAAKNQHAKDAEATAAAKKAATAEKAAEAAKRAAVGSISLAQFQSLVRSGKRTIAQYDAFLATLGYNTADATDLGNLLVQDMADRAAAEAAKQKLATQPKTKALGISDVEQSVKRGLLTMADYGKALTTAGYNSADIVTLEKLLADQIQDVADAEAARDAAKKQLAVHNVSLADLERAVRLGIRTIADYRARLIAEGFVADAADVLVQLLQSQLDADVAARKRRDQIAAAAAKKQLSLSQLETAVRAGVLTMAEYKADIADLGFSSDDQATLAELLQLHVDQDKAAKLAHDAAAKALLVKHISLGEVERAVKLGVMTLTQYSSFLKAQGFNGDDAAVLASSLASEVAATAKAKADRDAAANKPPTKDLSEAQERKAVLAGLMPLYAYQSFLLREGYDATEAQTLTNLLTMELDQQTAAEARQKAIDGELATKGISLSDYRAAVKADIKSLDDYAAFLEDQGYGEEDVSTLVDLLTSQLKPKEQGA